MSEVPPRIAKEESAFDLENVTKRVMEPLEALANLTNVIDAPALYRAIDMNMLLGDLDRIDAKMHIRSKVYDWLERPQAYGPSKGGGFMQDVAARIVAHDFKKSGGVLELSQTYGSRFLRSDVMSHIPFQELADILRAFGKHAAIVDTMFAREPEEFAAFMARYVVEVGPLPESLDVWMERQPLEVLVPAIILVGQIGYKGNVSTLLSSLKEHAYAKAKEVFGVEKDVVEALSSERSEAALRARASIEAMKTLESKVSGSVKRLAEEYGIREFGRYPPELLLAQLSEEETSQPYGVAIFPRSDHNGAFDHAGKSLETLFRQTLGHFGVKVIEVEDVPSAGGKLARFNAQYGNEHKISFAIIGGHGTPEAIQFGEPAYLPEGKRGNFFTRERAKSARIERGREFFVDNPTIVLISCSTGAKSGQEKGIAEELAKALKADVIAPKVDTNIQDLSVSYADDGKPVFEVKFAASPEDHARFSAK